MADGSVFARRERDDATAPASLRMDGGLRRGGAYPRAPPHDTQRSEKAEMYYVECPHCGGMVAIATADIHCGIFRHHPALAPHASQKASARVDSLYGCGGPFAFDGKAVRKVGWDS